MPMGEAGPHTDRDAGGRFTQGNKAALVVGHRSVAFWASQENLRREIVTGIVSDAGHSIEDAPRTLKAAAHGIAQALLLRDSAFDRLVESGGPLTTKGRARRAFDVWLASSDRLERHLRLVGLRRVARPMNAAEALARLHDEEPTT